MSLQTEEKSVVAPEATAPKVEAFDLNAAEGELERKMGLRIAGEALLREVIRYSGQAAIVVALVGVVGYAGYWSLKEMTSLPAFLGKLAAPFMPVQPKVVAPLPPPGLTAEEKAAKAEKARIAAAAAKRRHHHVVHKAAAPQYSYRRSSAYNDNPAGGQIIYQDGMITEYRWDKK